MAYSWEEIKFLAGEWWVKVPFKEKVREAMPVITNGLGKAATLATPMLALTAVKAARIAGMTGFKALNLGFWWANLQLALGWAIGWTLADIDNVFYAVTCNSKEETCQRVKREIDLKRWKSAWRILEMTAGEREESPVRNMGTLFVIGVMGIWIATSSASILALGVVFGLGVRLVLEVWKSKKYEKWYWWFKRDFAWIEHRIITLAITAMVVYEAIGVIKL